MYRTATFSPDRKYRYVLWRGWNEKNPTAMFIGFNPSTADESKDDPTIRRCIGFAKDWGYGGLCMMNLFAFRATDPKEILEHPDPVGIDNDRMLLELSPHAGITIAAWGARGGYKDRGQIVYRLLREMQCLGLTKLKYTRHPLYVPKNTKLKPFLAVPMGG